MAQATDVGSVGPLYRYPVKSMMGDELDSAMGGSKGMVGDRLFALADPPTGKIASAKNPSKWPNLFSFHATHTALWKARAFLPFALLCRTVSL